jgi:lipoprotein-anchoring transpeptidase ErfK/SrfK
MTQLVSGQRCRVQRTASMIAIAAALMLAPGITASHAQSLGYAPVEQQMFPPDDQTAPAASQDEDSLLPDRLRRTIVTLDTREAPGTIIIDTANTYLYYVLGGGRALRYGVGVGREGFTWSGVQTVTRKAEWPDWHPPAQMIARQPYLPRVMAGGPGNPLGARAMYLGSSEYRIHGTNDPTTIGTFVSSGCIRLTNEDVSDLFSRVQVGSKVVVLPKNASLQASVGRVPQVTSLPSSRQAMSLPVAAVN